MLLRRDEILADICDNISGYYNLDTCRTNKGTPKGEELFIDHKYGFFTSDKEKYDLYLAVIEQELSQKQLKNLAKSREEALKIAQEEQQKKSSTPNLPRKEKEKRVKSKKKRKKPIPKALRVAIWTREFGTDGLGTCCVCKRDLSVHDFEAGHIISEAKGGMVIANNLVPICGTCNKSMSVVDMREFMKNNGLGELKCKIPPEDIGKL